MGSLSIWHWLLVILVVVLLFGRGKISDLMGDVAKGIKSFKKGISSEDDPKPPVPPAAKPDPKPPATGSNDGTSPPAAS